MLYVPCNGPADRHLFEKVFCCLIYIMSWLEAGDHYWLAFLLRPSSLDVNLIVFHGFTLWMWWSLISFAFILVHQQLALKLDYLILISIMLTKIWVFVVFFYIILLSLSEPLDILRLFAADAPKLLLVVYLSLWSTAIRWRHWDAGTYLLLSILSFISLLRQFLQCCFKHFVSHLSHSEKFVSPFRYRILFILL